MTTKVSARASNRYLHRGANAPFFVQLDIEPERLTNTVTRPPLNLAIVLDRSGSMAGEKLIRAKEAAKFILNNLSSSDRASVVVFDEHVEDLGTVNGGSKTGVLQRLVDNVRPGGATDLYGGLTRGLSHVRSHQVAGVNSVLLLTDGQQNHGVTNPEAFAQEASAARSTNLRIAAFGVGTDFNESLLTAIGTLSGGRSEFLSRADEIPNQLALEVAGALEIAAVNPSLRVRASPGFRVAKILSTQAQADPDGTWSLPLQSLRGGAKTSITVQIEALPGTTLGPQPVASFALTFGRVGASDHTATVETQCVVEATDDQTLLAGGEDPEVAVMGELLLNAIAQDEARRAADLGFFDQAANLLALRSAELTKKGRLLESDARLHDDLDDLAKGSAEYSTRTLDPFERKRRHFLSQSSLRGDLLDAEKYRRYKAERSEGKGSASGANVADAKDRDPNASSTKKGG